MSFIKITNKKHRLGNGDFYYYHPESIEILLTPHEMAEARWRFEKAMLDPLSKELFPAKKRATFWERIRAAYLAYKSVYYLVRV